MSVIFLLIPLSVLIASAFLGAFIWAVRSGQYEDTCTPSMRMLNPDPAAKRAPGVTIDPTTQSVGGALRRTPDSFKSFKDGPRRSASPTVEESPPFS